MDPLNIHHVIRHRLSRIETNHFQDKSGCSINGFRSFLFEDRIFEAESDIYSFISDQILKVDSRGCPIHIMIMNDRSFDFSHDILQMRSCQFSYGARVAEKPLSENTQTNNQSQFQSLLNLFSLIWNVKKNSDDDTEVMMKRVSRKVSKMDQMFISNGHLLGIILDSSYFVLKPTIFSILSTFPYLRNLELRIIEMNVVTQQNEEQEEKEETISFLEQLSILSISTKHPPKLTWLEGSLKNCTQLRKLKIQGPFDGNF